MFCEKGNFCIKKNGEFKIYFFGKMQKVKGSMKRKNRFASKLKSTEVNKKLDKNAH